MHPAKTRTSLRSRAVWSEYLQVILWKVKDPKRVHADSEDPNKIARMKRDLI